MTQKEKQIILRARDNLRRSKMLRFHSREDEAWNCVDSAWELLEVLFQEQEKKADTVETIIMKKTTQRSPEWRGKANC